jgi:hypothetical protein
MEATRDLVEVSLNYAFKAIDYTWSRLEIISGAICGRRSQAVEPSNLVTTRSSHKRDKIVLANIYQNSALVDSDGSVLL